MTVQEAAALLGLSTEDLVAHIRESGAAPSGPEDAWRLEAAEVEAIRAERTKRERQNLSELQKLAGFLE